MIPLSDRDNAMATALQLAIERGELELLFQPKLSLVDGRISGVEALARWDSQEFGIVGADEFIGLAERAGLIDLLTEWALTSVLRQWNVWHDQGMAMNIALNVSATTLKDVDFPDHLQRLCLTEGVPCEDITIELTEGATQHVVRLLDTLTRFRLKGMGVALDDFGTGFSSLLQLRQLPFTELKIDQSFIGDVVSADDSRLIVKSIIDLAHALGLAAVAEGIEDQETLALLGRLGCDQVQGYFIARPMKAGELVPWILETSERWHALGDGAERLAS